MMLLRFIKDWTLPVAIATGALVYLLFAFTPELESAAAVLGPPVEALLPVSIFLTLFVTFSKVDFHRMRLRRWHAVILMLQLLLVGVMLCLMLAMEPQRELMLTLEAVLVCVIAPCAAATPVVTAKLGGDLTQMTTFALLSAFVASLMIPAVFPIVEPRTGMAFLPAFLVIFRKLAFVLLLPLMLGAIVRHWVQPLYRWFIATPDLGFYLWSVSLAITSGITVKNIIHSEAGAAILGAIAVLSLLTAIVQFVIGRFVGYRLDRPICCGQGMFQKNTGLAIWIAYVYLTPVASIGAGCYVLWQNLINSYELWANRKSSNRKS